MELIAMPAPNAHALASHPLPLRADAPRAELVRAMVKEALRTPSGANSQPWKLAIDDATVRVAVDAEACSRDAIRRVGDPIAVGAFAESLRLVASRRGFASTLVYDGTRDTLSIRMTIGEGLCAETDLASELGRRHTNRSHYSTAPLLAREATMLEAESTRAVQVLLTRTRAEVEAVADASALAERVRFDGTDPTALLRWLRLKPSDARRRRDGLDLRLLGLALHERWALRLMGLPFAMWCMRRLGAGHLAGRRLRRQILSSGGVGAIVIEDLSPESLVKCGRVMLRVWLRASMLGLAFAPVTVGAVLPLSRRFGMEFSQPMDRRLDEVDRRLRQAFSPKHHGWIAFLFRIGIAQEMPKLQSERRRLSSFIGDRP